MSTGTIPWLLAAVLLPLAVNEFKDWWPWLAVRLVRWSARRLGDPQACARYEEEWVANLQEVPGKFSPLVAAVGYLIVVPRMRLTIRRGPALLNVRPNQVPEGNIMFAGRMEELAFLDARLFRHSRKGASNRSAPMFLIAGTAGVGKTALILRWAHQNRDKFSDGNLYVNLRGYDPIPPADAFTVLGQFLCSLGVRKSHIPATLNERVAVYQALTARRRLLVVLDNAASADQVRPLLPSGRRSLVLISSRSKLSGLTDHGGTLRLALNMLDDDEAVELMKQIVGMTRVNAELDSIRELARLCAHLPLALRIAGERAVARPEMLFRQLVADLREESGLWEALDHNRADDLVAVRTVIDWSYRALPAGEARLFRRLGTLPNEQFATTDAALLAECNEVEARHLLNALVANHLLTPTGHDKFQIHPLLQQYAIDQLANEEPEFLY